MVHSDLRTSGEERLRDAAGKRAPFKTGRKWDKKQSSILEGYCCLLLMKNQRNMVKSVYEYLYVVHCSACDHPSQHARSFALALSSESTKRKLFTNSYEQFTKPLSVQQKNGKQREYTLRMSRLTCQLDKKLRPMTDALSYKRQTGENRELNACLPRLGDNHQPRSSANAGKAHSKSRPLRERSDRIFDKGGR